MQPDCDLVEDRCRNLPLRPYQRECAAWLAHRAYGLCALPMRAGKMLTTLAAAHAIGARKVLVICPAKARTVWAREIAKWLGEESVLTYGRGGDKSRRWGEKRYTYGRAPEAFATIANYEILIPHRAREATGKRYEREDLPGWSTVFRQQKWDLVIIDESHEVRCWTRSKFKTTREAVLESCDQATCVWLLTGTPLVTSPRDYGSQLDIASGGLYWYRGKPFSWDVRYCGAGRGQYGWELRQPTHVDELKKRLEVLMFQRSRAEILPDMPPKIRSVIRIENDSPIPLSPNGAPGERASKAMAATLKHKIPILISNLEDEFREGVKSIVFVHRRKSAEKVFRAVQKIKTPAKHWIVMGGSESARDAACTSFVDHDGPGVLVATIDTLDGAVSLRGATSEHWLEFHFNPTTMLQAEDRPYEPDTRGLSILYYILENSIDEHAEERLLPKVEMLAELSDKEQAAQFEVLGKKEFSSGLLEDVLASMMEGFDCEE